MMEMGSITFAPYTTPIDELDGPACIHCRHFSHKLGTCTHKNSPLTNSYIGDYKEEFWCRHILEEEDECDR